MSDTTKMMDSIESLPNFDMPKLKLRIIIAFVVSVAAYLVWFNFVVDTELGGPGAWGQFGDYLGGLLNPTLSAIALVILAASLSANVVALKQNEKILELTKNELVLTRQQIEDTEKALKKQTDIVHSNAYSERLGMYAQKVYEEIIQIRSASGGLSQILKDRGEGFSGYQVFAAFDVRGTYFNKIRKRDEWSEGDWEDLPPENMLKVIPSRFEELVELCDLSSKACNTNEMGMYYWNRLRRWFIGAHKLGYINLKDSMQLEL